MISSIMFCLSALVVICSMSSHYFYGRGTLFPGYISSIICAILAITLNTTLFIRNPENVGVLLFHFTSIWQICMSARGIYRIRNAAKK